MSEPAALVSQLAQWIDAIASVDPSADELEFEGKWQTWAELIAAADGFAAVLNAAGLPAGSRIGVLLRNHGAQVPVLLGLFRTARCLASINASAPDDKLADDIRRAAVPALVASEADWARPGIGEAAAAIGAVGIAIDRQGRSPNCRGRSPARQPRAVDQSARRGRGNRDAVQRHNRHPQADSTDHPQV